MQPVSGRALRPPLARARRGPGGELPSAAGAGARRVERRERRLLDHLRVRRRLRRGPGRRRLLLGPLADGGEGLTVVIPKTPMHLHIPIELDPPAFRPYRKVINAITAPAAIDRMTPDDRLLLHLVRRPGHRARRVRLHRDHRRPVDRHRRVAGSAGGGLARYASAHRATLANPRGSAEYHHAVEVDHPYLAEQMRKTIAARAREPRTTPSASCWRSRSTAGRSPRTRSSRWSTCSCGGTVTTSNLVSQALIWLYQHQDERRRLIEHPDLLDRAIEEFLRCFAPSQALARTVIQDVELFGCSLKKGDRALPSWASANRDEAGGFEHPDGSTSSGGRTGTLVRHRRPPVRRLAPRAGDGQASC